MLRSAYGTHRFWNCRRPTAERNHVVIKLQRVRKGLLLDCSPRRFTMTPPRLGYRSFSQPTERDVIKIEKGPPQA